MSPWPHNCHRRPGRSPSAFRPPSNASRSSDPRSGSAPPRKPPRLPRPPDNPPCPTARRSSSPVAAAGIRPAVNAPGTRAPNEAPARAPSPGVPRRPRCDAGDSQLARYGALFGPRGRYDHLSGYPRSATCRSCRPDDSPLSAARSWQTAPDSAREGERVDPPGRGSVAEHGEGDPVSERGPRRLGLVGRVRGDLFRISTV